MSTDQTDYELFVSYARKDNRPIPDTFPHGWVTAVRDFIVEDHRQYSADPMRIFFDTAEIRDMDDWRNRILGALRRSKVLLICLSPNYFASGPCRWEWDEFLTRQAHKLVGSEPHATIYFVEVPGGDEQDNARRLDAVMGKNFTDLRPWFPAGAAALQEAAVRGRMAVLGQSVWERISRARRALTVPGNLRAMTPYFIGRNRELADLHRLVGVGKIGLVAAVHGLGGQGKTELSVAYARGYADCYPLGLWALEAENEKELLPLLGKLAFKTEFGYAPTEAAKNDATVAGREVLAELQLRFDLAKAKEPKAEPAALVLLDNVSEPGLLAATQLSTLPKVDWLRVIATTRLDPKPLDPTGKSVGTVLVDALDEETALKLIENHQPGEQFRTDDDEAAAREIVRELGGFTLAVEQVAVYLAIHHESTNPVKYLATLRERGLPHTDKLAARPEVKDRLLYQHEQLGPVLESMLTTLLPAAKTLLRFASLLPPDRIPWPWLKELTIRRHPDAGSADPDFPDLDPWKELVRQVTGLRFLTDSTADETAFMHRLVGAHLRQGVSAEMDEQLREVVAKRADEIYREQSPPADWELDGLLEAIPHLLAARAERRLAVDGTFLSDKVLAYRTLAAAQKLLIETGPVLEKLSEADPANTQIRRDLAVSHQRTGNLRASLGDRRGASEAYLEAQRICQELADSDPSNADRQWDLSASLNKLGNEAVAAGDPNARVHFEKCHEILANLAELNPTCADIQRDLSAILKKLGEVHLVADERETAAGYFNQSLTIARRLAEDYPRNADIQRELLVSLNKLGEVHLVADDRETATRHFTQGLAIAQKLAEDDPTNAQTQRDLSISFSHLGDVAVNDGGQGSSREYYQKSLAIAEKLAASDPTSADKQRDIAVSYSKLATLAEEEGDAAKAADWWQKCVAAFEGMVSKGMHVSPQDMAFLEQHRAMFGGGGGPRGGGAGAMPGGGSRGSRSDGRRGGVGTC